MTLALKRLRLWLFGLQTLAVILFTYFLFQSNKQRQQDLAHALAHSLRENLLVGDTRSVIRSLNPLIDQGAFTKIAYIDAQQNRVISLEAPESQHFDPTISATVDVPVLWDYHDKTSLGTMYFTANLGPNLFYVAAAWFAFLLLSIPLFRFTGRHLALEEQVRRATDKSKAIADTVTLLVHDLKRPFFHINMALETLAKLDNIDAIKRSLGFLTPRIRETMQSANSLLDDLRDIDSFTVERREAIDINQVISSAVDDAQRLVASDEIKIESTLASSSMIMGDPMRIGRAIGNLMTNAVQACAEGGAIKIETTNAPVNSVMISFWNSGSTLSDDHASNIFEPFYTKGKLGGSGLGLTLTKKVVEAHKGQITCTSKFGKGVLIQMVLPTSFPTL